MEQRVTIFNTHFIKYDTTPLIDEYYLLKGKAYCKALVGNDSFHDSSLFNGISFKDIKAVVEGYVSTSLMHLDFSQAALRKYGTGRLNQWNFYTTPYKMQELVKNVSIYTGISIETVKWVTEILTLTKGNLQIHLGAPGSSLPPFIKIERDWILRSLMGFLSNPFTYLIRYLKHYHNGDYSVAVNLREGIFQKQFYSLFKSSNILKCKKGVVLKNKKKILTDIDALLYDINEETLLLVQLKWMDDFGASMLQRRSMSDNFYNSVQKWIQKVEIWLSINPPDSLFQQFEGETNCLNIKKVKLLVLGRHFSHFSDIEFDKKATYCGWPQLVKILKKKQLKNPFRIY